MLHYLSGKGNKFPWEILGLNEPKKIESSFTVSITDVDKMLDEIKSVPYSIIKIKLGFEGDEQLLKELENISGKLFRFDANGGWNLEKAEKMIYFLDRLEYDLLEQPTMIEHIKEWPHLKGRKKCRIFADEGLYTIDNYYEYCDFVDGINIKMPKSGGIIEAVKIARQAKKDKREVMLGCMIESSVGISQSVYLSSLADYFDLDSPMLIKQDIASGLIYDGHRLMVGEDIMGGPRLIEGLSV